MGKYVCTMMHVTQQAKGDGYSREYLRPATMELKIIDFGSATFESDYHSSLINTRQYRAPEVILGRSERCNY